MKGKSPRGLFSDLRERFHAELLRTILTVDKSGIPSNADRASKPSIEIAKRILDQIGSVRTRVKTEGQTLGSSFEVVVCDFLAHAFPVLGHLRPGTWHVQKKGDLPQFDQYAHLQELDEAIGRDKRLASILGTGYIITPDVVIYRETELDSSINKGRTLVDPETARLASIRKANGGKSILHATVSCKWTMRTDRAQNTRTEALNLIRNRKGRVPHIVVVTGEPIPGRVASLALGTGDIDCVYHFALPELQKAISGKEYPDARELLDSMVKGKRLRDIADLPLDLAV